MALTVGKIKSVDRIVRRVVADQRLFLTSDRSAVVHADDPRAAFLFCVPGQEIKYADAVRFGLIAADETKPAKPETKPGKPETKPRRAGVKIVTPEKKEEPPADPPAAPDPNAGADPGAK
jgi:hypothetical protein